MTPQRSIVFIVDDDQAVAESLSWLLESEGLHAKSYTSAPAFLDDHHCHVGESSCLVLDIRMPGMSGLELQERLKSQKKNIPIIFITGHGDIPMAVRAMKSGAVDFLIKPFDDQGLLTAIRKALIRSEKQQETDKHLRKIERRVATLTPRETEVMREVVKGKLNKAIAIDLGIGNKTVEIHRSRIMRKMQARSLAELVKMVMLYLELHAAVDV